MNIFKALLPGQVCIQTCNEKKTILLNGSHGQMFIQITDKIFKIGPYAKQQTEKNACKCFPFRRKRKRFCEKSRVEASFLEQRTNFLRFFSDGSHSIEPDYIINSEEISMHKVH